MLELQCCTGLSQFESYRCPLFKRIYTGKPGKGELHRIVMSYRSHVSSPPPKTALSATHSGAGSAGGRDFPLGAGQPADLVEDAMQ